MDMNGEWRYSSTIPDLWTRWLVSFWLQPLYPVQRDLHTNWTGGRVSPRPSLVVATEQGSYFSGTRLSSPNEYLLYTCSQKLYSILNEWRLWGAITYICLNSILQYQYETIIPNCPMLKMRGCRAAEPVSLRFTTMQNRHLVLSIEHRK
jgi:hypothetical protein